MNLMRIKPPKGDIVTQLKAKFSAAGIELVHVHVKDGVGNEMETSMPKRSGKR